MKLSIIVGSKGQDGQLLTSYLLKNKHEIIGLDVNHCYSTIGDWKDAVDISNYDEVSNLIKTLQPNEIYFLAAHHHSSEDIIENEIDLINNSYQINVLCYANFLESIKQHSSKSRIFYAGSSLMYGNPIEKVQNEETPFNPNSIYGLTKYSGLKLSEYYRENFSIFASVGILFNHESHLRSINFISRRIVKTAVQIKYKVKSELYIGNIKANIDWGYAGDFVEAFAKILNSDKPDNFVISTGEKNQLKNFIKYVFDYLNLNWEEYVKIDSKLLSRKSVNNLYGDYSKLNSVTGWKPKLKLKDLAELMVDKEILRIS